MTDRTERDNQTLIAFWDRAFSGPGNGGEQPCAAGPDAWRDLAPSEKLFQAAVSLACRSRVLDYGCGSGWAGIIAAKSGCADVTSVDVSRAAVRAAQRCAELCGAGGSLTVRQVPPDWLQSVPDSTYDGFICSSVLDVIPPETSEEIIRQSARITAPDACVIIGMNYFLSPAAAAARNLVLEDGCRLYVDGVLRLVSRSDEAWTALFAPYYIVDRLEHFAWPGEAAETRRLFYLRKRTE